MGTYRSLLKGIFLWIKTQETEGFQGGTFYKGYTEVVAERGVDGTSICLFWVLDIFYFENLFNPKKNYNIDKLILEEKLPFF